MRLGESETGGLVHYQPWPAGTGRTSEDGTGAMGLVDCETWRQGDWRTRDCESGRFICCGLNENGSEM
jgi:hypothetical protein